MNLIWSVGKKSAILGVRLLSRLLIKGLNFKHQVKHQEPLALFSSENEFPF